VKGPRVLVAGCGAIGAITAGYLHRSGFDVTAVDGWHRNVLAIRRAGLTVSSPEGSFTVSLPIHHLDELATIGRFDVALLAVKSYDTEWMTRLVLPYLFDDGYLVSAQNGINEDLIASIAGPARVLGAVVHMNGGLFEAGSVTRYSDPRWATFSVGELDGSVTPRATAMAEMLAAVGASEATGNILGELWAKLGVNAMTNGLAGISGLRSPDLWTDPEVAPFVVRLAAETAAVAGAAGVAMEGIHPTGAPTPLDRELLRRVAAGDAGATAAAVRVLGAAGEARRGGRENKASLLQDIEKGRRTEIDHLNGRVVAVGRELGVPTPANEAIVAAVKEVEAGERMSGAAGWRHVLSVA
jgi:2-dehydropantoate 2-reductase